MAAQFERSLIQHLVLPESLRVIVDEDIAPDMIPTDELRKVLTFAVDYWHREAVDGVAPSPEALRTHFDNILSEHNIDLDIDPEDTLSWTIDTLRAAWIDQTWQKWVKVFAGDMAGAGLDAKHQVLDGAIDDLMQVQKRVSRRGTLADVRFAFDRQMEEYEGRVRLRAEGRASGALLGLDAVDDHMLGTRPGELTVLAAGPKTGKSFLLLWAAFQHWLRGGEPVLATLENSVSMTLDRLACMMTGVDSRLWQRGECSAEEVEVVRAWKDGLARQERPFHIIQPEMGKRTLEQMVRRARTLGDALYLDQLTFVEFPKGLERKAKHEQLGIVLHDAKELISTGYQPLSLVMAHQVNREGVKASQRTGRLEMYHMAEASEVERTADFVVGLFQSRALREVQRAWLQMLAARRTDLLHWEMVWAPHAGRINVRGTIELPEDDD